MWNLIALFLCHWLNPVCIEERFLEEEQRLTYGMYRYMHIGGKHGIHIL